MLYIYTYFLKVNSISSDNYKYLKKKKNHFVCTKGICNSIILLFLYVLFGKCDKNS